MDHLNIDNAVIITIGNEILSGKTVDSNSTFIIRLLGELGIRAVRILSVGDRREEIQWAVRQACDAAALTISTGGLGPTHDDISKYAVAEYFGRKIILDREQLAIVEQKFRDYGYKKMPEINISQAEVPEGAVIFPNPRGTAPGLLIVENDKLFLMLPGVPEEMKGIMQEHMIPYLRDLMPERTHIVTRNVRTTGMGESRLAEILVPVIGNESGVEIAYLPDILGVDVRLTVRGKHPESLEARLRTVMDKIVAAVPGQVYGFDEDILEAVVGALLRRKKLTLAIAESCTGGLVGDRITDVPGSSDYFDRDLVTYSNQAKVALLGVRKETLSAVGAVSEETAREMAQGIQRRSGCSIGVSVTGIAGPGGGSPEKPVGLVYLGLADRYGTIVQKLQLGGDRIHIKKRSAQAALNLIRLRINDTNLYRD